LNSQPASLSYARDVEGSKRFRQRSKPVMPSSFALLDSVDGERKNQMLACIEASIPKEDLPAAMDLIISASTANTLELRERLMSHWAQSDPASAAAWAAGLPQGSGRGFALQQVAIAWANADLPAAALWIQSLPLDRAAADASIALAYEAARIDPLTALETAGRLAPTAERDDALVHAISQWASSDLEAARDWASGMPDSDLRQQLLSAVAIAAAAQNGPAAANLAANLQSGTGQNRAVVSIVQQWAQTSPEEAAAWITQFPEGELRAAAAENLAAIWWTKDPQAATQWFAALPQGSLRDATIRGLAQTLPASAPP